MGNEHHGEVRDGMHSTTGRSPYLLLPVIPANEEVSAQ
jgi:hypothetical protein